MALHGEPIHDTTPRTTATSEAEGRMKVDVGMHKRKRKYLKKVLKNSYSTYHK